MTENLATGQRYGEILVITMRRDQKRNAIDVEMAEALDHLFNELDDDDRLRVGILAGGEAAFSAGTDISGDPPPPTKRGGEYGFVRRLRTKPVIAAVEGPALGGGFELVLACDLVVASHKARFGLPEVSRGLFACCGGVFRLPRALPLNVAKMAALTGEPIDAETCHRFGLVNVLTEPGQAVETAVQIGERICANAPISVAQTLGAMDSCLGADDALAWEISERANRTVLDSDDSKIGKEAFARKVTPNWTGR